MSKEKYPFKLTTKMLKLRYFESGAFTVSPKRFTIIQYRIESCLIA